MSVPARILLFDPSREEAGGISECLKAAGIEASITHVAAQDDFAAALCRETFDVILCVRRAAAGDELRPVQLAREEQPLTPILVIADLASEAEAVRWLEHGAVDYLRKGHQERLPWAVRRALAEAEERRQRQQAEHDLLASRRRLRAIIDTEPECVKLLSADGGLLEMNPAGLRMIDADSFQQVANKCVYPLVVAEYRDAFRELTERAFEGKSGILEFQVVGLKGSRRWLETHATSLRDDAGRVVAMLGITRDITTRRNAEEQRQQMEDQLRRSQRMEAIGSLTSGIAHDLNNIFSPIVAGADLLKLEPRSPRDEKLINLIASSATRGSGIVRQLLTFGRGAVGECLTVPVPPLIEEVVSIIRETFPREISVDTSVDLDAGPVLGDATQLHQVLLNLCVNARDAMPRGGRLLITARNVAVGPAEAQANAPAKAGPHVAIVVTDTGGGIEPGIIDRIFDPFFTTKPLGEGTGLGLSTALGIVRSHGGYLKAESRPGTGATFAVLLPIASRIVAPPAQVAIKFGRGTGQTVLLVDDESAVRETNRMVLEEFGYRVIMAESGQAAISAYARNPGAVKVLVTDLMMPGMDGIALIRALRDANADLKVIAISGVIDPAKEAELRAVGVDSLLMKPCLPSELAGAISRQLQLRGDT